MFSSIIDEVISLKELYTKHLSIVDDYIQEIVVQEDLLEFLLSGKRIRSIILFLCSRRNITRQHYIAAAIIELLHAASLIHDDILDQNFVRRNTDSFLKTKGAKLGVLFGDMLFVKCAKYINELEHFTKILFRECHTTVYGAILEQTVARPAKDDCIKIAAYKTGALFKCASFIGTQLATNNFSASKKAAIFGKCFGIIYQIQNDLDAYKSMEYTKSEDYVNKNITLPLLASNFCVKNFVNHTSQEEYNRVRNSILSQKTKTVLYEYMQKYCNIVKNAIQELS